MPNNETLSHPEKNEEKTDNHTIVHGLAWFSDYNQYRQTMSDLGFFHLSDKVNYQEWEMLVREIFKEKKVILKCSPDLNAFHNWCITHPDTSQKEKQARFISYFL